MIHTIHANNVNDAALQTIRLLHEEGVKTTSDKGAVIALNRVAVEVSDTTNRWLTINGRNNSIVATIAEIMWIFSGRAEINDWLVKYLPRATDFSDDGVTWRAAYGPRIYAEGQLDSVVDRLRRSKVTRQAMISLYDPYQDTDRSLIRVLGHVNTKDQPCNNLLYFFEDHGKLSVHLTNRSNDIIWGAWSINFQEFSILLEIIAQMAGMEVGSYSVYQNNLHAYLDKKVAVHQFDSVYASEQDQNYKSLTTKSLFTVGNVTDQADLALLFKTLMNNIDDGDAISNTLKMYEIPEDSELADWCRLIKAYNKKTLGIKETAVIYCPNLLRAVQRDKFNSDLVE